MDLFSDENKKDVSSQTPVTKGTAQLQIDCKKILSDK